MIDIIKLIVQGIGMRAVGSISVRPSFVRKDGEPPTQQNLAREGTSSWHHIACRIRGDRYQGEQNCPEIDQAGQSYQQSPIVSMLSLISKPSESSHGKY